MLLHMCVVVDESENVGLRVVSSTMPRCEDTFGRYFHYNAQLNSVRRVCVVRAR